MKKLLMVCCFVVSIVSLSKAQGGGGRGRMNPADQAKQLQTALSLNDDLTAKITAIFQAQATKMDSIRTAANGDRQAMMGAMQPLRKATTDKVKAVLTADQVKAYDKWEADRRAQMQQRMGGGGGGTPPPSQE